MKFRGGGSEPTFFVMRRNPAELGGLFAYYLRFAAQIRYALSKGYLPVVDMQNYPNIYLEPNLIGKVNAWEYYFCQPLGITLEDAYNGKNILLGTARGVEIKEHPLGNTNFFENKNGILTEWKMLIKLGLLKIQPALHEKIMELRKTLFNANDRVLGVVMRGTDYVSKHPHGHYIQPPIEYALTKVVEKFNEWHCNKIFLATEDIGIAQVFKNVFRDICVTLEKGYVNYDPSRWLAQCPYSDCFLRGAEYLTEVVLVSTCNCLVAGRCGASVGAAMMGNFENIYTFNLGKYGVIGLD